jgi:uncharacterized protein YndB with AHSA1/START domain
MTAPKINPTLDLVLERTVDIRPQLVWDAWTKPEHIVKFFTPKPWETPECRVDLRPGGEFYFLMRSPEGEEFPNTCCYLEIEPGRKLVWTNVLGAGYRPASLSDQDLAMTATILIEPQGQGTKYTAIAQHRSEADVTRHEEMGFHDGWSTVVDQLVAYMKTV